MTHGQLFLESQLPAMAVEEAVKNNTELNKRKDIELSELKDRVHIDQNDLEPRELKELRDPNWILDRRNSGKLFWRRDSFGDKNRVKFRCDVEVLEYLRTEAERTDDWSSDDDDEDRFSSCNWPRRSWDKEIPPPNSFFGGVCALVIAAVLTYQWFSV